MIYLFLGISIPQIAIHGSEVHSTIFLNSMSATALSFTEDREILTNSPCRF